MICLHHRAFPAEVIDKQSELENDGRQKDCRKQNPLTSAGLYAPVDPTLLGGDFAVSCVFLSVGKVLPHGTAVLSVYD
jgi:hypothetical protein